MYPKHSEARPVGSRPHGLSYAVFMQVPNKCRTSAKTQTIDSCFPYRANPVKHKTGLFEWALCFQLAH